MLAVYRTPVRATSPPALSPVSTMALLEAERAEMVTSGPEVRGTGEALAPAVAGHPIVLDELEGDGVGELRGRMGG
jgi:hypothetical protein